MSVTRKTELSNMGRGGYELDPTRPKPDGEEQREFYACPLDSRKNTNTRRINPGRGIHIGN